ncbi:MAG TPA: hypothetical protein VHE35_28675 [Kofleriaceae bacterium]|nr:hypothetical protein [Kofleriaceae bacterium]
MIAVATIAVGATAAHAYPQYQLSHEQTCGACHVSPTGGGLLNDNGELTAQDDAHWAGDPTFLHGAVTLPDWLRLGGDFRAAAGATNPGGGMEGAAFPMQAELHAAATKGPITLAAELGYTQPKEDGSALTALLSREHYVRWNQHPDNLGLYVQAGRFMPTYGLRLAEHTEYVRRYGGTPLYGEVYGVALGWISSGAEAHVTGFVHDSLRPDEVQGDGAAAYVEKRFGRAQLGVEGRYAHADDNARTEGGLTGKLWLDGPAVLLSAEVQAVHQTLDAGPARNQIVGNVMASWFVHHGYLLDVVLGHFDEDVKVPDVDRDAIEANLHWFAQSHVELVLMTRYQAIGFGKGGDNSGYVMAQLHYRL